jgi:hypothetical protein
MASRQGGAAARDLSLLPVRTYRAAARHRPDAKVRTSETGKAAKDDTLGELITPWAAGRSFWERSLASGVRCAIESLLW